MKLMLFVVLIIIVIIISIILFYNGDNEPQHLGESLSTWREMIVSKDKMNRSAAAQALGIIGDKTDVPRLIKALQDEDPFVRESAAVALKYFKDKRAVEPLIVALKDSNRLVRRGSSVALGEINDKKATPSLIDALYCEENKDVRFHIERALAKITDQNFGYDTAKWQTWWDANKDRILKEEAEKEKAEKE